MPHLKWLSRHWICGWLALSLFGWGSVVLLRKVLIEPSQDVKKLFYFGKSKSDLKTAIWEPRSGSKNYGGVPTVPRFPGRFSSVKKLQSSLHTSSIPAHAEAGGCFCQLANSTLIIDMCYRFRYGTNVNSLSYAVGEVTGRPFDCRLLPYLQKLGLMPGGTLDGNREIYGRNLIVLDKLESVEPEFVTASSHGYYPGLLRLIHSIRRHFRGNQSIIVYDLGMADWEIEKLKSCNNLLVRELDFASYPSHVANLPVYAWKPIVIAHAIYHSRNGAIWYMDSSVVLKHGNLAAMYEYFICHRHKNHSSKQYNPNIGTRKPSPLNHIATNNDSYSKISKFNSHFDADDTDWLESGFHADRWARAVDRCDKYPYLLHGFSGQGVYPMTHKDMYKYIPSAPEQLKRPTCRMYEAGLALVLRTKSVVEDVLKWYVLCALEPSCIAPEGATNFCPSSAKSDRFAAEPAGSCHRFDQSAVNVLLANLNSFRSYFWTSQIVDFFKIDRGRSFMEERLVCG